MERHVPLFHPRNDRWSQHFAWDGPLPVAKCDIGQVTIDVLVINRADRVAVRRALIEEGVFPSKPKHVPTDSWRPEGGATVGHPEVPHFAKKEAEVIVRGHCPPMHGMM